MFYYLRNVSRNHGYVETIDIQLGIPILCLFNIDVFIIEILIYVIDALTLTPFATGSGHPSKPLR